MELLYWFVFAPLFIVVLLALKDVHLPSLIQGGFVAGKSIRIFLWFCSIEILLFFQGKTVDKVRSLLFVCLLNIVVFCITIGMYGASITRQAELPIATVMQMVRIPGGFVERLDIFLVAFWILSLFAIFSAYCFYGTNFWKEEVRKKHHSISWISIFFYAAVFGVVVWNSFGLQELLDLFQSYLLWIDIPLAIVLPLLSRPHMKQTIAITMLTMLLFILTGCGPERVNIEDRAYVLAIGIEQTDEELQVGFFLPEDKVLTIRGRSWKQIESKFQTMSEKELEMGHLKAVIVREGADFSQIQTQWKEQDYPKSSLLFWTDCSIQKFKKAEETAPISLGSYLSDLAKRNEKEVTIGDYLSGKKQIPKITIWNNVIVLP